MENTEIKVPHNKVSMKSTMKQKSKTKTTPRPH